jgi:tripartite-type tricarboxylate transporter receptor subunit TctC
MKRLAVRADIPAITETPKDLVAPARTPPRLVERLSAEIRSIMTSPEIAWRTKAPSIGIFRRTRSAHVAAEIPRWKAVIDTAKVNVD